MPLKSYNHSARTFVVDKIHCLKWIHSMITVQTALLLPAKPSSVWFRGWSIIITKPNRPCSTSQYHQILLVLVTLRNGKSLLMHFKFYCRSLLYMFSLVWCWKITHVCGRLVNNETLASDLDWKYICYPTISNTFLSLILTFSNLCSCALLIFSSKET